MSCHHRHGPWCCDNYYNAYPGYPSQSYTAPAPLPYPPSGYAPMPVPPRRSDRGRDQEELNSYLEYLENELAQVRERVATMNLDAQNPS